MTTKADRTVVFLTQPLGSDARLTLRRDLRTGLYSAIRESVARTDGATSSMKTGMKGHGRQGQVGL